MHPTFLTALYEYRVDQLLFALGAAVTGVWLLRHLRRRGLGPRWYRGAMWALTVMTIGGVLVADLAARQEQERMRAMLEGFAPTYAIGHEQLGYADVGLDTAADDPTYLRLIEQQKQWLRVNPSAHDIYTFHRDAEGATLLVVDSETDYDHNGAYEGDREARTDIGELYDVSPEETELLDRVFAGEPRFDHEPVADRWGVWVSAYAPLHDRTGRVIGVLGVDYDASKWLEAILGRRAGTLLLFGTTLLLLIGAGSLLLLDRERALHAVLATKNDELESANDRLRSAMTEAEAANQAKSAFLANMSHELRTPLTSILGFTDLLADPSYEPEQHRLFLDTIRRSGRHLLEVLSDILDLSKLEADAVRIQAETCDANAMAAEVAAMLNDQARRRGLELRVEPFATRLGMLADPFRLRQILVNLVGNAIKFTKAGSVVVQVQQAAPTQAQFRVVDTGPGIAPEAQKRLFQPFRQIDDSASRQHGGTGLGLAISRRLARAMGGDITVSSEPGRGSTFVLRLPTSSFPAAAADAAPAQAGSTTTGDLHGRVLLVEDGPDNRRLLGHLLRRAGLDVAMAENGRDAVDLLLQDGASSFDLVLMDMQMPVLDGYEATQELRRHGIRKPVVAITANALQGDRERCLAAGCDDFVSKPVDRGSLIATLRRWLVKAT
ncbi:MAG: response regulator [Planctomycetes bacterium]|nr:response regulator [Planctomycetota bacterium]